METKLFWYKYREGKVQVLVHLFQSVVSAVWNSRIVHSITQFWSTEKEKGNFECGRLNNNTKHTHTVLLGIVRTLVVFFSPTYVHFALLGMRNYYSSSSFIIIHAEAWRKHRGILILCLVSLVVLDNIQENILHTFCLQLCICVKMNLCRLSINMHTVCTLFVCSTHKRKSC